MLQTDSVRPASGTVDEVAATERMVLFVVGEHRFGVPIGRIREIIPQRPYTPLPGSEAFVCGLINLRGRIVTVVDLGARLGLAPASFHPDHSVVIVEHRGRLVGLAVQEVARIVAVDPDTLLTSGDTLRALSIDRAYLRGVGEADDEIFVAVDPDQILDPILV
ncbi:MAG TPA: chemotaxis protein CheW [Longimicrobiaceae bacterium]|nr:chemotaxis protein CheW [Longimicrobiaceae bacterium]